MSDIQRAIEAIRLAKTTLEPALQKSLRDFLERLSERVEEYRKFRLRSHYFPWQDIRRVVEKIKDLLGKARAQGAIGLMEWLSCRAFIFAFEKLWLEKEDGHRLLEAMEGLKGILEAIQSSLSPSEEGEDVGGERVEDEDIDEETRRLLAAVNDAVKDFNEVYEQVKRVTNYIASQESPYWKAASR
jgi:hypothetical protein